MKIHIINQEPLEVNEDQARTIMENVARGAEIVFVGTEMVKSSAIMGIRSDVSGQNIEKSQWGALPAGAMTHSFDDRREPQGDGYAKFMAMKSKLLSNR